MTTPDLSLEALEKIARAAIRCGGDPWAYAPHGDTGDYGVGVAIDEHSGKCLSGLISVDDYQVAEPVAVEVKSSEYAAHISTFDPPQILKMIARQRELEAALVGLTKIADGYRDTGRGKYSDGFAASHCEIAQYCRDLLRALKDGGGHE